MKSNIVNFDNIIKKVITNPEKYKKLGRGGQADVYLYIDNNDKYAIRIPKTKLTKHEIKILEKIRDINLENLITVFYFKDEILVTPVYEYDANKWMETKRTDDEWEQFIKDIKKGIESLASINICHRDLKPRNILVKNNRFYITDFGHSLIKDADINLNKEIELCILNRKDHEHILNLIPRLKVNNMIKKYTYNQIYNFAKKYQDFDSYFRSEQKINNKKKVINKLKKFLLTKSICYFLVEKDDRSTFVDGIQKLPSKKIQVLINQEFS